MLLFQCKARGHFPDLKVVHALRRKDAVSMLMLPASRLHKELKWWCRAHITSDIKSMLTFGVDGDGHLTYKGKWKPTPSEIPWVA